jgi:hypothetical protein
MTTERQERRPNLLPTLDIEHLEKVLEKLPEPQYVEISVEPTTPGVAHSALASLSQRIGFPDRIGFSGRIGFRAGLENKYALIDGTKADILKIERESEERGEAARMIRGRVLSGALATNALYTRFNKAIWSLGKTNKTHIELTLTGLKIEYSGKLHPVATEISQSLSDSGIRIETRFRD